MHLKNNAGGWLLPEGRRTKGLDCLCGTVTGQVTSSLTCNTKSMLQIHCCQLLCLVSSAMESQPFLTSSFPSLRPCRAHGALCRVPPPRGRTGERTQQPSAKVKAGKEGSVSSIRSAQSGNCFCNASAPGPHTVLPVCWMLLYKQHPLHPVPMVLPACSMHGGRWGKGVRRKQLIMRTSQNCFQPSPFQCLLGIWTLR